jgi:voltage-gated potassium channel
MEFTYSYLSYFVGYLAFAAPLLGLMAMLIIVLGLIVGRIESWNWFDSIYWAFITATTVGYGDIRPLRPVPRLLSILVALVGVIFTGLLVALAVSAATQSLDDVHQQGDAAAAHTAATIYRYRLLEPAYYTETDEAGGSVVKVDCIVLACISEGCVANPTPGAEKVAQEQRQRQRGQVLVVPFAVYRVNGIVAIVSENQVTCQSQTWIQRGHIA